MYTKHLTHFSYPSFVDNETKTCLYCTEYYTPSRDAIKYIGKFEYVVCKYIPIYVI